MVRVDGCPVVAPPDVCLAFFEMSDILRLHCGIVGAEAAHVVPPIKPRTFYGNSCVSLDSSPTSFVRWINLMREPRRVELGPVILRAAPQHPRALGGYRCGEGE